MNSAFSGFLSLFDDKANSPQNDRINDILVKTSSAMEHPEGADLARARTSFLLFTSPLLVTLHSVFKTILVKDLQKLPKKVLLDLKGQEYLLFRIYLEKNMSEKLMLLAVVSAFAHIVIDAFTIYPFLNKYISYRGQ